MAFPAARIEGLVVQEVGEETLVYDLRNNRAHCLNYSAALIWDACNGNRGVDEIAGHIVSATGERIEPEVVGLALKQLSERDLLTGHESISSVQDLRRELLKKIGAVSVAALPIISSIVVPASALAQTSFCGVQTACSCPGFGVNGGSCASNDCSVGCTCRDLFGCNPGGRHCRGTCGP